MNEMKIVDFFRYVQPRDAGKYECQVSTDPKMMSYFTLSVVGKTILHLTFTFFMNCTKFSLFFLVPKVLIRGNQDIHVQAGSQVELSCVVSQAVEPPAFVVW